MDKPSKQADAKPKSKRAYKTPRLVSYGHVRSLTQGGASMMAEGVGQSMVGTMMTSERALKENISRIGTHPLGIGLYLFDYKPGHRGRSGPGRRFGVMADEVEAVLPQAVSVGPLGYKVVDYGLLGIAFPRGMGR